MQEEVTEKTIALMYSKEENRTDFESRSLFLIRRYKPMKLTFEEKSCSYTYGCADLELTHKVKPVELTGLTVDPDQNKFRCLTLPEVGGRNTGRLVRPQMFYFVRSGDGALYHDGEKCHGTSREDETGADHL